MDTASKSTVRVAKTLGTSERFWLGLQADNDVEAAHSALGDKLDKLDKLAYEKISSRGADF